MDQYHRYLKNGKEIYDEYCSSATLSPVMLPRAPQQRYIDVYPAENEPGPSFQGDVRRQADYEEEVKVYRALERIPEKLIVLHSFEYTHHQYRLCDKSHVRKECSKCKGKKSAVREGECDFLIIGTNYFVVIEVKNVTYEKCASDDQQNQKFNNTFQKSVQQRNRIGLLIRSLDTQSPVFLFTAYPNLSSEHQDKFTMHVDQKRTTIFKEDIDNIKSWWQRNVLDIVLNDAKHSKSSKRKLNSSYEIVRNMLLAIWCTDKDDCDKDRCSLGRCIKEIDGKLRSGRFTFRSNNPNVVSAPDFFRNFLGIDNITKQQHEAFTSNKKFLIIDGPAGCGKSSILIAKIIQLIYQQKREKVILFTFFGEKSYPNQEQVSRIYKVPFNKACIPHVYLKFELSDELTIYDLIDSISRSNAGKQVFIVELLYFAWPFKRDCLLKSWLAETLPLLSGYDIFIDDVQSVVGDIDKQNFCEELGDLLNSLSEFSNRNHVWLACDILQMLADPSHFASDSRDPNSKNFYNICNIVEFSKLLSEKNCISIDSNHRNTCDISKNLSILRDHIRYRLLLETECGITQKILLNMNQNRGHCIHGPMTEIHVFDHKSHNLLALVFEEERKKLKCTKLLTCSDRMIIEGFCPGLSTVTDKLYKHKYRHQFFKTASSAEWPAVIVVHQLSTFLLYELSMLYFCMSRARVYCTILLVADPAPNGEHRAMFNVLHQLERNGHVHLFLHEQSQNA